MTMEKKRDGLAALLAEVARTGYRFVPVTPATHARVNARPGNEIARDLAGIFGWSRPFAIETAGQTLFRLLTDADAVAPAGELWKSRLRIATLGEHLYLHSAYPTVESDAVFFGPDTCRFIRAALECLPRRPYRRAVDLGCGSGAGGLAVAGGRVIETLTLADINPRALELAAANAAAQHRKVEIVESDLFAAVQGQFDLVLANPPYLADPGKRAYRDGGGPLGLDLGLRIVREGSERLNRGGILLLYTGVPIEGGRNPLLAYARSVLEGPRFIFDYAEIDPDVFGEELERPAYRRTDRLAAVVLIVTRTG